jgi:signal transduction histidine kinase
MRSLLGVPIFSKGALIGALYLSDKQDDSEFTETDQQLIEMLALHAAIAIENANLYEKTQRLAILEERERFARDLHDGIIQSIYAVGLSLDNIKAALPSNSEDIQEQIDVSLKSMASVINDLRNYIFDLRPQALRDKGLFARLDGLIKELRVNTLLAIQAEIDPEVNHYLTDPQASHIFHIAHEALSNAARHAHAKKIKVNLARQGTQVILRIEDDGIGFSMPALQLHGHHGLANIQKRAKILEADLKIGSAPGQGTCITLNVIGLSKPR